MAVSYKGLVIKFGGDTTELQGALRKVSKESKNTQADLKEINKALKFNPGNTDLLQQKVRALNSAYGETKQKLDAYRQAMAQLEAKKQSGEKLTAEEQRQYDSLQRSIMQCENQLDSYGKELSEAKTEAEASKTALYKLGQTIEDNADKLNKVGGKVESAGKTATVAFGGMATAAVAAFNQVEEAENIAVNGAGAMGEAADEIRRSVRDVAANAPGDLETVGQAVGDVNTHFQVTGERLDQISGSFLKFSKITGGDVSTNIENVAMSMKAFNVDSSQTELVLDHLASTSTATGVGVDTLTGAVNQNGATLREMGLSLQDSITLIGNFEAAGVPASDMLTGLKKAAANCAKEGVNMGDMLTQLTADLQDPAKQAEATQTAFDLFGTKAATAFIDAAESGRVNFSELGGSLSDAEGFVNGLTDETMSSSDKMQEAFKNMTLAGAELGEQFAPVIDKAAEALKGFTEWVRTLSPEQKQLFAGVVTGGVAFGGLTIGIGKTMQAASGIGGAFKTLAGGLGTLKGGADGASGAFSLLGGGWKGLTGLISANPIGLGIAAVSAAVAGLTWFFTQTETGKQMWADFTGWISEKWQAVQDFFAGVPEFWGGIWSSVTEGATNFGNDIAQTWDSIKTGTAQAWDGVKNAITSNIDNAKSIGSSASSVFKDAISGDWQALASDSQRLFGDVDNAITSNLQAAKNSGIPIVSDLASGALDKWNWLKTDGVAAFGSLASGIASNLENAKAWANEKAQGIVNFWQSIPNNIIGFFSDIGSKISNAFGSIHFPSPHVEWGGINIGDMHIPLPTVRWYASGGYFDQASIIGVGERGGEFVAPEKQLWNFIERAVNSAFGGGQPAQTIAVSVQVNATVADGMDAYTTGQQIGTGIARKLKQRGVSVAT